MRYMARASSAGSRKNFLISVETKRVLFDTIYTEASMKSSRCVASVAAVWIVGTKIFENTAISTANRGETDI